MILAVMGEQGKLPVPSLVESACRPALKLASRSGESTVAICSLGVPDRDTGRQAARAIRSWLEEASGGAWSPPAKKQRGLNPPGGATALPQKVVYNAAAPRELAGAISVLRRWREELYLDDCYYAFDLPEGLVQFCYGTQSENILTTGLCCSFCTTPFASIMI